MASVRLVFRSVSSHGRFRPITVDAIDPCATRHHPKFLFGLPTGVPVFPGADSEEPPPETLEIGVVEATFTITSVSRNGFRDRDRIPPTLDSFGYPRGATWYRVPGVRSKFQRRSREPSLERLELDELRIPAYSRFNSAHRALPVDFCSLTHPAGTTAVSVSNRLEFSKER